MESVYSTGQDAPKEQGQEVGEASTVEILTADTTKVSSYIAKSKLRRVDHYSRMALLAAGRALENVSPEMVSTQKTGLIIATGFGALNSTFSFLDSYLDQGDKLAAPTWFSGSVHNAAAAYISICYGLTGPCLTVSQFDLSFASALLSAQAWLNTRRVDTVLIGAVDEWCNVSGYCIQTLNTHAGKMKSSFGEGASFFLVTRETDTVPAIGFLENIYIGRDLNVNPPDMDDIIFSPCAANEKCNGCSPEKNIAPNTRLRKRVRAGSPTDMGMDVWFALSAGGDTGEKTCCIKQGANQMFGSVTAIKAH